MRPKDFMHLRIAPIAVAMLTASLSLVASAALPPPTPEQKAEADAKKAKADAQAEKDKQALSASMDTVAERWRKTAASKGWKSHPPTPIASASKEHDKPATQTSASGQPGGKLGEAAAQAPIRSEKTGTAPPSEDVKKTPADQPKQ